MSQSQDAASGGRSQEWRRRGNALDAEFRSQRPDFKILASNKDSSNTLGDDQYLNFSQQISLSVLVQVLLKKGILTVEELEREQLQYYERQKRDLVQPLQDYQPSYEYHGSHRGKHRHRSHHSTGIGWLKKHMARFRWSRRLGTILFGWKWKRISKGPA